MLDATPQPSLVERAVGYDAADDTFRVRLDGVVLEILVAAAAVSASATSDTERARGAAGQGGGRVLDSLSGKPRARHTANFVRATRWPGVSVSRVC